MGQRGMIAIFQKPLHYQHENLWSGKKQSVEGENLIKLYVFALVLLVAVVVAGMALSHISVNFPTFLFSGKVFRFEKENFNEIELKEFD